MNAQLFYQSARRSDPTKGFPHLRHVSVIPTLRKRGRHPSNIWIFDSPKNNRRFAIDGDIAFMHAVLLEGDKNILAYDYSPRPVTAIVDNECYSTTLDAVVTLADGRDEWWEFKWSIDTGSDREGRSKKQLKAQAQAAQEKGVTYRIKTENDLRNKELLFDNWLLLCAAITRANYQSLIHEMAVAHRMFQLHRQLNLSNLLNVPETDPALMLAVIGKELQTGRLEANLETEILGLNSILVWRQS